MASEQEVAAVAAAVAEDLQAWAAAHPAATLLELEVETARRRRPMAKLRRAAMTWGMAPVWAWERSSS